MYFSIISPHLILHIFSFFVNGRYYTVKQRITSPEKQKIVPRYKKASFLLNLSKSKQEENKSITPMILNAHGKIVNKNLYNGNV
jgi:hypothetical protein